MAKDREQQIEDLSELIAEHDDKWWWTLAEILYDAGYRKVEAGD